jgi:hypothetical protein
MTHKAVAHPSHLGREGQKITCYTPARFLEAGLSEFDAARIAMGS